MHVFLGILMAVAQMGLGLLCVLAIFNVKNTVLAYVIYIAGAVFAHFLLYHTLILWTVRPEVAAWIAPIAGIVGLAASIPGVVKMRKSVEVA